MAAEPFQSVPNAPPSEEERLESYFKAGIDLADLPDLFPLRAASRELAPFAALFRGPIAGVMVKLLVLRELCNAAESVRWTIAELRTRFAYLEETKLPWVLEKLRDTQMLERDEASATYQLTPLGRMVVSALGSILRFAELQDGDLGFLLSQVAGDTAVGKVSAQTLQHLLSRLRELHESLEAAIVSQSEFRVRAAEIKLGGVIEWVEKGTVIMRQIIDDPALDGSTLRIARQIGRAQGRLLKMAASLKRTIFKMEQQHVHLGQSGLSSSDVIAWLSTLPEDRISALIEGSLCTGIAPEFVLSDLLADIASSFLEHEREDDNNSLPAPQLPSDDPGSEIGPGQLLQEWVDRLREVTVATPVPDLAAVHSYSTAAYRLSTLTHLGDSSPELVHGPAAELCRLPLELELMTQIVSIERDGIAQISDGTVRPIAKR